MKSFKPYQHQLEIADKATSILKENRLVYLACSPRVGKTIASLITCDRMNYKSVLFVTKAKAISSVKKDLKLCGFSFDFDIVSHAGLHKATEQYDCIIIDEAHAFGSFTQGKQSKRSIQLEELARDKDAIYLSGTPSPEDYLQVYHQFKISSYSPFEEPTFWEFIKNYGTIEQVYQRGHTVNLFKNTKPQLILDKIKPLMVCYSREDAGFEESADLEEHEEFVAMNEQTNNFLYWLENDGYISDLQGHYLKPKDKNGRLTKAVQIASGTVKTDSGESLTIDNSKALRIKQIAGNKKIIIFYSYKQELSMLKEVFPNYTLSADEFQEGKYSVMLAQIISQREGVDMSAADLLFFLTVPFSSVSMQQGIARILNKNRTKKAVVYWMLNKPTPYIKSIGDIALRCVRNKQKFTATYFEKNKQSTQELNYA